ncbi:protein furry-like [Diaphorina citri]|uniref:Protein furry-like n=1 Tax=Diaphorina citri TaxID=121845 RepID=A0A3Q0IZF3_DIACI|nr:protein furry-like [Diaphorina citri]
MAAPNLEVITFAKRVVLYVARARPDRLLDEMVTELQTVETLSWLIERTETPPFYRLTSMRKPSNHSDLATDPDFSPLQAKRVVLYVARARPDRLLDEMVTELQTVETLSWLIERTETPPFYRLTSMRKPSNHSDLATDPTPVGGALAPLPGTIHTKRHSAENDTRNIGTCKSDSAAVRNSKFVPPRGSDKIRTASGPAIMSEEMFTPPDMEVSGIPDMNENYRII